MTFMDALSDPKSQDAEEASPISSVANLMAQLDMLALFPETLFRGQGDISWPLVPSIVRFAQLIDGWSQLADLEEHLLERFAQYSVPFRDLRSLPVIERLVHCQHYGLPTRLLDWSTNPLKALFFAVEDPAQDAVDGALHVLVPTNWYQGTSHLDQARGLAIFFPDLLHDRINAQDGCFTALPLLDGSMDVLPLTLQNYPKDIEEMHSLVIPKAAKRDIRRQLAVLGVTHRTVYPGLDGIARWVKSELSDFVL
jgi:hypothetical protein